MSYVGTPRYLGSDLQTLASILQGEAGGEGPQGLQAVASVIQNRAKQNFSGYGSDPISQALAKNQFQGQSPHPSPEALAVAQQLAGGSLANDPTHGALYYANPGASSASWARNLNPNNSLQIGHHYFTDNTSGSPFAGAAPGPDGPKGQEAYAPPAPFGSMSPPMMAHDNSIDPNVAKYAFADDKSPIGNRLSKAGELFSKATEAPRLRPGPFPGGPSAEQAGGLLKATSNTNQLAQMLLGRRMA
ncbi:cell wall hydrolase [Mesorhizobium sp. URHB0026]